MNARLGILLACVASHAAIPPAHGADPVVSFEREPTRLRIRLGQEQVGTYVWGDRRITRPYFEHLRAPDGTQLTRNNPPVPGRDATDHDTYHPGLWLAFGDLNGADSWRVREPVRHAGFVQEPQGGPGRGRFAVRNEHHGGGKIIAHETCSIEILSRPAGTLLIWDSRFAPAEGDLIFGDQEEMGLGVRMATPLTVTAGGIIRNRDGLEKEREVWGKASDWCSYIGRLEGREAGVTIMPDPANFRRSWFHARDYGLLVANPFGRKALTGGEVSRVAVRPGEELRLRFGVLLFAGQPGATDPEAAYRDFQEQLAGRE